MRTLKVFASGSESQQIDRKVNSRPLRKEDELRMALMDCKQLILELNQKSHCLLNEVEQKGRIISHLVQEKQSHMLHMSTCNSQMLSKQIQQEHFKQQQMKQQFQNVTERYERIIEKNNSQINKIKSYNRALRVQNAHLRQKQENEQKKKRKIGAISFSSKIDSSKTNSFEVTQINSKNQEQIRQRSIEMVYQTPQSLKSLKSEMLPSTAHSPFQKGFSEELRSKDIPRNLFKNQFIQELPGSQSKKKGDTKYQRQTKIENILKRVSKLLQDSEEDDY